MLRMKEHMGRHLSSRPGDEHVLKIITLIAERVKMMQLSMPQALSKVCAKYDILVPFRLYFSWWFGEMFGCI